MKHEPCTEPLTLLVKRSTREALAREALGRGRASIASVVRDVLEQWASKRDEREAAA